MLFRTLAEIEQNISDFLVNEKAMDPYDAYTLLSIAGDVRVSRTFRPISPVKMMLSRTALEQLGDRLLFYDT